MRDGNYPRILAKVLKSGVLSLPMRDGNYIFIAFSEYFFSSFELTYEGWKLFNPSATQPSPGMF